MAEDPGPQPPGRLPGFEIPRRACDCHAHILGPLAAFPYAEERSYTPPEALREDYLSMIASLGIERTVIVQPSVYGTDNACTVAAVQTIGPHRARGVAMIGPMASPSEVAEFDRMGIRAARFVLAKKGGPPVEALDQVARLIAPFGWHIELFSLPALWPEVLPRLAALPVPVLFDHLGAWPADTRPTDSSLRSMLRLIQSGRFWTKLTSYRSTVDGYPYADAVSLTKLFIQNAPERCVWGTDWPHTLLEGPMPPDVELLELLNACAPDPAIRRKILVENPATLYGFESG